jgi:restriction system protein
MSDEVSKEMKEETKKWKERAQQRVQQKMFAIEKLINQLQEKGYIKILAVKYKQSFYKDEYGDLIFDRQSFENELEFFMQNKINWHSKSASYCKQRDVRWKIKEYVRNYQLTPSAVGNFDQIENPIEYERAISDFFTQKGWNSIATQASGDQGADVIAEKSNHRVVVQCKLYSQPVGNKAVQEVMSAKTFYECTTAIVVTNASYTKSARQLAHSCGVELLHHDELDEWILKKEL